MRSVFLIGTLTVLSVSVFGQLIILEDSRLSGKPMMIDAEPKYTGSPHLESKWNFGKVLLLDGRSFENVLIRYNIFEDLLEYVKDGRAFILDPTKVREFSYKSKTGVGETTYVFRNGFTDIPEYSAINYFEVVYHGEKSLLLRKYSKKIINDPSATYGSVASKALQDKQALYYKLKDGSTGILKTNRKNVLGLFPGSEKMVAEYVKTNKLSFSTDYDLRLIFAFVDSLR